VLDHLLLRLEFYTLHDTKVLLAVLLIFLSVAGQSPWRFYVLMHSFSVVVASERLLPLAHLLLPDSFRSHLDHPSLF